jgi:hypothetical protein
MNRPLAGLRNVPPCSCRIKAQRLRSICQKLSCPRPMILHQRCPQRSELNWHPTVTARPDRRLQRHQVNPPTHPVLRAGPARLSAQTDWLGVVGVSVPGCVRVAVWGAVVSPTPTPTPSSAGQCSSAGIWRSSSCAATDPCLGSPLGVIRNPYHL